MPNMESEKVPKSQSENQISTKAPEIAGKDIPQTSLVPEGFKRVKLESGQEYLTSVNCEVKKIKSSYGDTWFIKDNDNKIFIFASADNPSRNEVLEAYQKGQRIHISKFKNFIHVELTLQNPSTVVKKMSPK